MMEYFVRTIENHKKSTRIFSPEVRCRGLRKAADEAKRKVLEPDSAIILTNRNQIWAKYRCWINERGEFHERTLV
jgi:hypothetical protein